MTDFHVEYDPDRLAEERRAAAEAAMAADGVSTVVRVQQDYFGFDETHSVLLPDGMSVIEFKVLNEGQRRSYLNKTNRDVKFEKRTGDASMRLSPGDEKHALLSVAITGWNLVRNGAPILFNQQNLNKFLELANPKIIDIIHKAITKVNPWLLGEMTVEDIDREIEALEEQKRALIEEEAGKASS